MFPIYIESTPLRCVLSMAERVSVDMDEREEEPVSTYNEGGRHERGKVTSTKEKKDVIELISGLVYIYCVCRGIILQNVSAFLKV